MKQQALLLAALLPAISAGALLPSIAFADNVTVAAPVAVPPLDPSITAARGPALDLALEAARTAIATCATLEQKIGVSVIDSAGILKTVLASDGATPRGVQSSNNKALTALAFKAASSQLGEQVKTDKALADKIATNPGYNVRAGGVLIKNKDGEIIGAIGVGGAKGSEKDEACAVAGLEKIQARL